MSFFDKVSMLKTCRNFVILCLIVKVCVFDVSSVYSSYAAG